MTINTLTENTVVYDGDCGICEASAGWIIKHVPDVKVQSHREYGLAEISSVWFIYNGQKITGAPAIARILRLSDIAVVRVFGRLLQLPLIRLAARVVYAIVARNRRHLSKLFGLKACGLPQR